MNTAYYIALFIVIAVLAGSFMTAFEWLLARLALGKPVAVTIDVLRNETRLRSDDTGHTVICENVIVVSEGRLGRERVAIPGLGDAHRTLPSTSRRLHLVEDSQAFSDDVLQRWWGVFLRSCCTNLQRKLPTRRSFLSAKLAIQTGEARNDALIASLLSSSWLAGLGEFSVSTSGEASSEKVLASTHSK